MQNSNKKEVTKKHWAIQSFEGKKLNFFPIFEVDEESGDVQTKAIQITFKDEKDKEHKYTFNWLDIYMFVYFISNEELRMQLAAREERKINYIPYDLTFKLTPEEKAQGFAKRRVELPVDELTMAIARNEAYKIWFRNKHKDNPKAFLYQPKRK